MRIDRHAPRFVVNCGWGDVPHILPDDQCRMLCSTPPWQREARALGIPELEWRGRLRARESKTLCRWWGSMIEGATMLRLAELPRADRELLLALLSERMRRRSRRKIDTLFPELGPLRRELYQKHLEFFRAGLSYPERCFMAANRVGKTEGGGGYELALHLTGEYPSWWEGRRFAEPIHAWAAGKTAETTRDIIQSKLLGKVQRGTPKLLDGTGIIPGANLGSVTWKNGIPDFADTIEVKHTPTGGWSVLGLKSYEQGRGAFEGTEQAVIWLDEEPPEEIYGECLIRTMTVDGMIMLTFTPLEGMSSVVIGFLPEEFRPPAEHVEATLDFSHLDRD